MKPYGGLLLLMVCLQVHAQVYEISGSPFDTEGAPLPEKLSTLEKVVLVDPNHHFWGAYSNQGRLVRWGIATTGAKQCRDQEGSCQTSYGTFRIYSLGSESCVSRKYDGAAMPYCMFFNGGEALHGSSDIQFSNASHGCVRVHISDAKWLRYHFVEGPNLKNNYKGTKIIILPY
jgi:hypothetical protein